MCGDPYRWAAEEPYEVEFGSAGKLYKLPGEVRRVHILIVVALVSHQYEPYVIALRAQLPSYDERFRGAHFDVEPFSFDVASRV